MSNIVPIVTSTNTSELSRLEQLIDNNSVQSYKWFILGNNTLGGDSHLIDQGASLQVGLIGKVASNASGIIQETVVTLQMPAGYPLSLTALDINGSSAQGIFPVDFIIRVYKESTLLKTVTTIGNNNVSRNIKLEGKYDATAVELSITKINKPNAPLMLTEVAPTFARESYDTLSASFSDASMLAIGEDAVDTTKVKTIEDSNVIVRISASDILKIKTPETSFLPLYEVWSSDTIKPKSTDVSTPVRNTLSSNNSILVKSIDTKNITAKINRADTAVVNKNIEGDSLEASFGSVDSLPVTISEATEMTNVHTQMDNMTLRQVHGKVEIVFTNPLLDNDVTYSASETYPITDPQTLADGIEGPKYKYMSMHRNDLSGKFHVVDSEDIQQLGWWGNTLSDSQGVLVSAPTITVDFIERPVADLKVVGDKMLNNYPVDFDIRLKNAYNEVFVEQVRGNTNVTWLKSIPEVTQIVQLQLVIYKISQPNSPAMLQEFFTAVKRVYTGQQIVSIDLLEELKANSNEAPLGYVTSNEIDIIIDNTKHEFNVDNPNSPIRKLMKKNRRVRAWLGVEIIKDNIEWHQLGEFWSTAFSAPDDDVIATITARDLLEKMRFVDFEDSIVYENKSAYYLFDMLLKGYGLREGEYYVDNALSNIIFPYSWFPKDTYRAALEHLAQSVDVHVYCDKTGKVIVNADNPTPDVMYVFDDDKNVIKKDYPLRSSDSINYVEVQVSSWSVGDVEELYYDNEAFTIPAGQTVIRAVEFSTQPCKEITSVSLGATTGVDINYETRSWGAILTLTNNNAVAKDVDSITITGKALINTGKKSVIAKDDKAIKEDGKISITVSHDFIQTTSYATQLSESVLLTYLGAVKNIQLETRGNIALRLLDRVTVKGQFDDEPTEYKIIRQNIKWDGSLSATQDGALII